MQFSYKQTFAKDNATVLKMFCDPAYHKALQEALGAMNFRQVDHSDDGTRFMIKVSYEVKSSAPLPGFAKKVLGETTTVTQTERWDRSSKKGEVIVEPKGLPGKIRCSTSLAESGGSSTKTFDWEVSVKIPLVGGKLEDLIAEDIRGKNPVDAKASQKLLEKY
ncbi:DUF2505 domain-containing protein [Solimonas sp. SE-A11]|uniref:DUF2505 domain-containing protein n=1 Tax=Solimonas sp. SE-A11 TaxID=3054954 RepID=UPI00259D103B|nr:DUF2505 domain-containing protein [Solimonas sp. SE-A11]MDM4772520.1 DUF2505 domain-containing protein [Solimonas sp. SE-A11]